MNIYELIGLIIGDGHIIYDLKKHIYRLEIVGNAKDDENYFKEIANLIKKLSGKEPTIRIRKHKRGHSLNLHINNKKFVGYLIDKLELPSGKKTFTINIPNKFLRWKYAKHILRGIFESDGSIYFSKSKVFKYPTYPRIEIKTSSKILALQLISLLKQKTFKVQTLKSRSDTSIKVYISGTDMLDKWVKEIGMNNIKNMSKVLIWKRLGYYIPKTTFKQRLKILGASPNPVRQSIL